MKYSFYAVLTISFVITCTGCSKDLGGITLRDYPRVDGSTSTRPLNMMVACKLLDIHYEWFTLVEEYFVQPTPLTLELSDFFNERILCSQTHGAFMNLIDRKVDIILTHRTISPDEKIHAISRGVTLIETPIASDAFVFVVNKENPIKTLKVDEIQKIYTEEITNWSEVGGNDVNIKVFTRPRNSGSEEVFREIVMRDLEPGEFPEAQVGSMAWVFREVKDNTNSICYSFNNYKDVIARMPDDIVPKVAINGIFPDNETVKNGTYPFISEVHVAIRSDLKHNTMAYKLYKWLQSDQAKSTLIECGFLPK